MLIEIVYLTCDKRGGSKYVVQTLYSHSMIARSDYSDCPNKKITIGISASTSFKIF